MLGTSTDLSVFLNCLSSSLQTFVFQVQNHDFFFFSVEEVGVGHSSYIIALSAQDQVQRKRFSLALWTEMCQGRDGVRVGEVVSQRLPHATLCVCLLAGEHVCAYVSVSVRGRACEWVWAGKCWCAVEDACTKQECSGGRWVGLFGENGAHLGVLQTVPVRCQAWVHKSQDELVSDVGRFGPSAGRVTWTSQ